MRKIALLLTIALNFSAFAGTQYYDFTFSIKDIPVSFNNLSEDATYYLMDTKNQIVAYASVKEYKESLSKKTTVVHSGGTITLGGVDYTAYAHNVTGGDIQNFFYDAAGESVSAEDATTKMVKFAINMKSDDTTVSSILNPYKDEIGVASELRALLYDPNPPAEYAESPYSLSIEKIYYTNASGAAPQFQASSPYVAIPEPSSALLMVFGLAGLALRRRKAA